MKVLIQVYTNDEHGQNIPGEIIDLEEAEADIYVERQWGIILEDDDSDEGDEGDIETPEDGLPGHETATRKRKRRR